MKMNSILNKRFHKSFTKKANKDDNEFDFKRARHEIFKFGISGLDKTEKQEAKIAHAISLGAIPRKAKYKNYKKLMEELKQKKLKQAEEAERNNKSGIKNKSNANNKTKKNLNAVKGFDYQIGKYKDGVQFVNKKDIINKRRK